MAQYLRPETLFGNKFESYLNAPTTNTENKSYDTDEFFNAALARSLREFGVSPRTAIEREAVARMEENAKKAKCENPEVLRKAEELKNRLKGG